MNTVKGNLRTERVGIKFYTTVVNFWKHKNKLWNIKIFKLWIPYWYFTHVAIYRLVKTMDSSFSPKKQVANSTSLLTEMVWHELESVLSPSPCLSPFLPSFPSFWINSALQRGARQTAQKHPALWCAPIRETGSVAGPGLHCLAHMSQLSLEGIIAEGCESKSMINNKLHSVLFLGFLDETIGKGTSCGGDDMCYVDRYHPGKSFIVEVFISFFMLSEHLHSLQISYTLNVAQGLHSEATENSLQSFRFSLCLVCGNIFQGITFFLIWLYTTWIFIYFFFIWKDIPSI